jgi:hypothetical protein
MHAENSYKSLLHLPDQVQGQVAHLPTQTLGHVPDLGPFTEGPGPTSSPESLQAPRVACHCSPVGFDRQHIPNGSGCGSRALRSGRTCREVTLPSSLQTYRYHTLEVAPNLPSAGPLESPFP